MHHPPHAVVVADAGTRKQKKKENKKLRLPQWQKKAFAAAAIDIFYFLLPLLAFSSQLDIKSNNYCKHISF